MIVAGVNAIIWYAHFFTVFMIAFMNEYMAMHGIPYAICIVLNTGIPPAYPGTCILGVSLFL